MNLRPRSASLRLVSGGQYRRELLGAARSPTGDRPAIQSAVGISLTVHYRPFLRTSSAQRQLNREQT